ncbi:MAG: DUF3592 domain-containing protein [Eubacterium sp.]|nr:DUF3592 domain-containing protein [Eubacterium sp.]
MEVMILAGLNGTASKIFGIILIIVMLIFPVIGIRLTNSKDVKKQLKLKKNCRAKTQGRILDIYGTAPPEFRDHPDSWSGGDRTFVSYEYFVNGVRYTGSDEIFTSLGTIGGSVNVLYDPKNPSINCTPYGKKADNGTNYIIAMLIIIGIIAFILLSVVSCSAFLDTF